MCRCSCHQPKEAVKPEAWEEEFKKIKSLYPDQLGDNTYDEEPLVSKEKVKSFIRQILQAEKDRIRGEVEEELIKIEKGKMA